MNEIADILEKAAALIEPEGAWTQDAMALDSRGSLLVDGYDQDAVCWCGLGAVECFLGADIVGDLCGDHPIKGILDSAVGEPFDRWNDAPGRTQSEVVEALRKAAVKVRLESTSRSDGEQS